MAVTGYSVVCDDCGHMIVGPDEEAVAEAMAQHEPLWHEFSVFDLPEDGI